MSSCAVSYTASETKKCLPTTHVQVQQPTVRQTFYLFFFLTSLFTAPATPDEKICQQKIALNMYIQTQIVFIEKLGVKCEHQTLRPESLHQQRGKQRIRDSVRFFKQDSQDIHCIHLAQREQGQMMSHCLFLLDPSMACRISTA